MSYDFGDAVVNWRGNLREQHADSCVRRRAGFTYVHDAITSAVRRVHHVRNRRHLTGVDVLVRPDAEP